MKYAFEEYNPREATLERIGQINAILAEYKAQGFRLTVRQLYYQLVARGLIPNTQREYKNLVALCTKARMGGLIDWDMIEDRIRRTIFSTPFDSPDEFIASAPLWYRIDLWYNQNVHIEVMLEKDALSGVLSATCRDLCVRLIPNRGYSSASTMYNHGWRLWRRRNKHLYILYVGDHDPSGLDMDRDIKERLTLFSHFQTVHVERLALTMEQIEERNPPPDPAKLTDSRADWYISQFGNDVWELDALEPQDLRAVVRNRILELRDEDLWQEAKAREEDERQVVSDFCETFQDWEADQ